MMKNMSEQDIENMIREMDNMPAAQLNQMKAMGMDPAIMKQTMNMIKDNPSMRKSMAEMMGQMSPEEIMERSRQAQESIKNMNQMSTPPTTAASTTAVETKVTEIEDEDDEDDDEEEDDEDKVEVDPEVLDAMFRVGEIMSGDDTSSSGVTFDGFKSLPPIAIMSSTSYGGASSSDDDLDLTLTKGELTEAWNKGSLGATRVDRAGFERVWMLIQDEYYNDIVEEARERLLFKKKQKKRGYTAPKPTAATTTATTPMVGANVPPEMLQQQLKNLKDDDFKNMLEQMKNISPEEEARMRAMGVDPAMMQKSAEMMSNNPLLRKAATMMMKNAKPEDLMKQSQMAQEKMANMSEEDKKKFLDSMK